VLVLRSYPDGTFLPKSLLGLFELVIAPKCLDPYPSTKAHLATAGHSIIYAQDIMAINEAQRRSSSSTTSSSTSSSSASSSVLSATDTSATQNAAAAAAATGSFSKRFAAKFQPFSTLKPVPMADTAMFSVAPLDIDGEVSQLTLDRLTLLTGIVCPVYHGRMGICISSYSYSCACTCTYM